MVVRNQSCGQAEGSPNTLPFHVLKNCLLAAKRFYLGGHRDQTCTFTANSAVLYSVINSCTINTVYLDGSPERAYMLVSYSVRLIIYNI